MHVWVVHDPDALGQDYIEDIDIVTTKKGARKIKHAGEGLEYFSTEIITPGKSFESLMATLTDDDDDDMSSESSGSESEDDETLLPEKVYVVSVYEEEEAEGDLEYEDEFEVFTDKKNAKEYKAKREKHQIFKSGQYKLFLEEKPILRYEFIKKSLEKEAVEKFEKGESSNTNKTEHKTKSIDVPQHKTKPSSDAHKDEHKKHKHHSDKK